MKNIPCMDLAGWLAAWDVIEASRARCIMSYQHKPGQWPWAFRAVQCIDLTGNRLRLTLRLKNMSNRQMPAGLGFHPYFPNRLQSSLRFFSRSVWMNDYDALPEKISQLPEDWNFHNGQAFRGLSVDNCFVGFDGKAFISTNKEDPDLLIDADKGLTHAVLYVPANEDFFCFEPVNHMSNALGGQHKPGTSPMPALHAGETTTASLSITISPKTSD